MDEFIIIVAGGGAASIILLCLIVYCIRRCCCRRQNAYSIDGRQFLHEGTPEVTLRDNENWLGNDGFTQQAVQKTQESQKAQEELYRSSVRVASNFCRSVMHVRKIVDELSLIGYRRDSKFYYTVVDEILLNERQEKSLLMVQVDLQRSCSEGFDPNNKKPLGETRVMDFKDPEQVRVFQLAMTSLDCPWILRTYEVGLSIDQNQVFFFRPVCRDGSLKDLIHNKTALNRPYVEKYLQRQGKRLTTPQIKRFGFEILKGLSCLASVGWPFIYLHTGNVVVQKGVCKLTDIECAFCGYDIQTELRDKLTNVLFLNSSLDPLCLMFGYILFEMATGLHITQHEANPMDTVSSLRPKLSKELIEIFAYIFGPRGLHTAERRTCKDLLQLKFFNRKCKEWDAADYNQLREENREIKKLCATVKRQCKLTLKGLAKPDESKRKKKKKKKRKAEPEARPETSDSNVIHNRSEEEEKESEIRIVPVKDDLFDSDSDEGAFTKDVVKKKAAKTIFDSDSDDW